MSKAKQLYFGNQVKLSVGFSGVSCARVLDSRASGDGRGVPAGAGCPGGVLSYRIAHHLSGSHPGELFLDIYHKRKLL